METRRKKEVLAADSAKEGKILLLLSLVVNFLIIVCAVSFVFVSGPGACMSTVQRVPATELTAECDHPAQELTIEDGLVRCICKTEDEKP